MSDDRPSIVLPVDLTNPGQFFACCGLLELASRLDPEAHGCFSDRYFSICGTVDHVLDRFFSCEVKTLTGEVVGTDAESDDGEDDAQLNPHRHRTAPMKILDPFNLRLDWWNEPAAQNQKLKTWTAGQRVTDLLNGYHKVRKRKGKAALVEKVPSMRERFRQAVESCPDDWLRATLPIEIPSAFNYDSRLSRNNALDLGHTDGGIFAFSAAVDVLTLIGFQRFRPLMIEQWLRNSYCAWCEPLPVQVATVAALGLIPTLVHSRYEFPIKPRDAQGRYKLFGHAQQRGELHV